MGEVSHGIQCTRSIVCLSLYHNVPLGLSGQFLSLCLHLSSVSIPVSLSPPPPQY